MGTFVLLHELDIALSVQVDFCFIQENPLQTIIKCIIQRV